MPKYYNIDDSSAKMVQGLVSHPILEAASRYIDYDNNNFPPDSASMQLLDNTEILRF